MHVSPEAATAASGLFLLAPRKSACYSARYMAENKDAVKVEDGAEEATLRIYEVGYTISPSIKEEDLEKHVGTIRAAIEKAGGSFIAEGAPALTKLAYDMSGKEGDRTVEFDRGYFGWIKFEAATSSVAALEETLKADATILRFIIFRTVREDTRAKIKAPTLREVKRTDVIKSTPRRAEEAAAPVSEEDLDKALQDITVN